MEIIVVTFLGGDGARGAFFFYFDFLRWTSDSLRWISGVFSFSRSFCRALVWTGLDCEGPEVPGEAPTPGRDSGASAPRLGDDDHGGKMSHSSTSDELDKDRNDKSPPQEHLTETQEDLIESGDRPFTEKWDVEQQSDAGDVARERSRDGDGEGEDGGEGEAGAAMSRVSSRPSVNNIKSVPNGGLRAWLQVLSSFFVFFNVS